MILSRSPLCKYPYVVVTPLRVSLSILCWGVPNVRELTMQSDVPLPWHVSSRETRPTTWFDGMS